MNLFKYIVVIAIGTALATGSFDRVMAHLAENPVPTWFAMTIIIPVLLFGLLAIAVGDMDAEEEI